MIDTRDLEVELRTLEVRRIPGTLDLEIDLMYIVIDSTQESDVFTFKLATCLQIVENASIQH